MATKTATKKKTAVRKSPTTRKTSSKKREFPIGLFEEKHPENHIVTGKYRVFFVVFGVLMVAFAALSVKLFVFSSNLLEQYEKTVECSNSISCNKHVDKNAVIKQEPVSADNKE